MSGDVHGGTSGMCFNDHECPVPCALPCEHLTYCPGGAGLVSCDRDTPASVPDPLLDETPERHLRVVEEDQCRP